MNHTIALLALCTALLGTECEDTGARLVPGATVRGPRLRDAGGARAWRYFTPPHRRPVPQPGSRITGARPAFCMLTCARSTGLLLCPARDRPALVASAVRDVVSARCR